VDIATTRILDYYILPCKAIFRVVVNFMKCLFPILKEYLVSRQLESSAFASIIYNGSQIVVKKARSCGFAKLSSAIEQWSHFTSHAVGKFFRKVQLEKLYKLGTGVFFRIWKGMVFFWGEFSLLHTLTTLKKSIFMFERIVDQKDHEVGVLCATLCMV
jgi:hypothetical protein